MELAGKEQFARLVCAIGVSIEDTDGAVKPGEMFLFAEFQQ